MIPGLEEEGVAGGAPWEPPASLTRFTGVCWGRKSDWNLQIAPSEKNVEENASQPTEPRSGTSTRSRIWSQRIHTRSRSGAILGRVDSRLTQLDIYFVTVELSKAISAAIDRPLMWVNDESRLTASSNQRLIQKGKGFPKEPFWTDNNLFFSIVRLCQANKPGNRLLGDVFALFQFRSSPLHATCYLSCNSGFTFW